MMRRTLAIMATVERMILGMVMVRILAIMVPVAKIDSQCEHKNHQVAGPVAFYMIKKGVSKKVSLDAGCFS